MISFILSNFYGLSAKGSARRSDTLKSENKAGKNIGKITVKETIEKISESDRKRLEEIEGTIYNLQSN